MTEIHITESCADTDQGSRNLNEDSYVLLQDGLPANVQALLAVADGIGGLGSGHVASSTALTTLADVFTKLASQHTDRDEPPVMDWLSFGFQKANAAVLRMALTMKHLHGMGTTCTAAAIAAGNLYVCHVGDSRVYILRGGELRQITQDDWYRGLRDAENGRLHKAPRSTKATGESTGRSAQTTLVTQAVGWQPLINPTKIVEPLQPGDLVLLCTDGLTDSVPTPDIEKTCAEMENRVVVMCRKLIEQAVAATGADNTTVVAVRIAG